MKVAAITGPRCAELVDVPDPAPHDNVVVVKVHAAPMCAEYKQFLSGSPTQCLGHEAAGEVAAVAQSTTVKVGDRVVVMPLNACGRCEYCWSGEYIYCPHQRDAAVAGGAATYAQYLLKADWLLMPIPPGVSYEHAAMACCGLGPTFGAISSLNVGPLDKVLITGAGPVGLGGVINAHYRGAKVFVVEGKPYRAAKARALGAAEVFDPARPDVLPAILSAAGGEGIDKAVECSGVPAAHRLCIDATCRRGQVAFVGESYAYGPTLLYVSQDMIRKGLRLRGSWHYPMHKYPAVMRTIQESGEALEQLITHRLPMSRIQEAFGISASGQCGKIVLDPWK